jgi:hypothetical protein
MNVYWLSYYNPARLSTEGAARGRDNLSHGSAIARMPSSATDCDEESGPTSIAAYRQGQSFHFTIAPVTR